MQLGVSRKRQLRLGGVFFLALFFGLLASFVGERILGEGRVLRGVKLGERSLSGLDRSGVANLLARYQLSMKRAPFVLTLRDQELRITGEEAGLSLDIEVESNRVLAQGRRGSWPVQAIFWMKGLVAGQQFEPALRLEGRALEVRVKPWAAKILPPPLAPSLSYKNDLVLDPGRAGTEVHLEFLGARLRDLARTTAKRSISGGPTSTFETSPGRIEIPTKERAPQVHPQLIETRRKQAEALVTAPIQILAPDGETKTTLSSAQLGAALEAAVEGSEFKVTLSIASLREALGASLRELEKPAVDASFDFKKDAPATIHPSETGLKLNEDALVAGLFRAAATKIRRVTLVLDKSEPRLTTEQAEALGELKYVNSFVTRHPCCEPRVQNIHTAAAKLDGVVLRPGEKFSLNELLGPRTSSSGYVSAPTIVRGEMEDMHGGGISQLATTLFNVVLRGGYEIIQRQPHSVYFSRYPEGHEATVSFPEPDLIFRNDTAVGMVIKTEATPTQIRVIIYGDTGGRVTTVKKSSRYKIERPPQDFEADDALKPGEFKRVRAGQLGWTVLVSRTVKMADGSKKEEQREVVYNPRPELLRVHSCMIPKGEEGHTGQECPEPEEEAIEEEEEELSGDVYYDTLDSD